MRAAFPSPPVPPVRCRTVPRALPAALLCLGLLLAGAGCRSSGVTGVEGVFRADTPSVDFGLALEGAEVVREVPFTNTGRAGLELVLEAGAPFSTPSRVSLPGGATVPVAVRFLAGAGEAQGRLRARAGERSVEVALRGEGMRALACLPSAACRVSEFVLEARACVERVADDGAACTPESLCLEGGVCRGGACLGQARSCDDRSVCTTDGCAEGRGCVHTPIRCPAPSNPCEVALCDPVTGCRVEPAPDLTLCGPLNCEALQVCRGGVCTKEGPPPDGTPCGPASPCRGPPTCQGRVCTPDPAPPVLAQVYRVELPGAPVSALRGYEGNVFTAACAEDGGCALVSRTGAATHGFERYTAPLPGPVELVSVSAGGVLLLEGEVLAMHALAPPGAERWRFRPDAWAPTPDGGAPPVAVTAPDRIVTGAEGEVVVAYSWRPPPGDGGGALLATQTLVTLASDGGVRSALSLEGHGTESLVAQAEDGALVLFSPEGPVARAADGGPPEPVASAPGPRALTVGSGSTVLGAWALLAPDGGTAPLGFVEADQPAVAVGHLPVLVDPGALHVFGEGCARGTGPQCPAGLRVYAFTAGRTESSGSALVLTPEEQGRLVEAAVLEAPALGRGLGTVLERPGAGGGVEGVLQLLARGTEVEQCLLPDAPDQPRLEAVARALFEGDALYVVVRREGRWWLEAYGLGEVEASGAAWPQPAGVAGSRRAR